MKCYTTNKDGVFICTEKTLEKDERIEMNLIKAYPEVRYQEVLGMGGALTNLLLFFFVLNENYFLSFNASFLS